MIIDQLKETIDLDQVKYVQLTENCKGSKSFVETTNKQNFSRHKFQQLH
jgi:hypothetical protein